MNAAPDKTLGDPEQIIADLRRQLAEARQQQAATAEVLHIINSSPGDLAPVFDAILEKAHSLCDIAAGSLELYDGENFRAVATHGVADSFADQLRQGYPASDNPATRPLIEGQPFSQILDVTQHEFPFARARASARTLLCVPLRRDDKLLGMIACAPGEVRPFTDKQIALLQNFAAQAVIAMENARLIAETREALEQQTATAEVLQVINSSPGNLTPVFEAMLEKAIRLCGGDRGVLWTIEGGRGRLAAARGLPAEFVALLRERGESGTNSALQRVVQGEWLIEFPDTVEVFSRSGDPHAKGAVEAGVRSAIWVAIVKEGVTVGAFAIGRSVIGTFSDKQIALLQNFAAQAVIAMENARLLTETREALEQQTATAEVLQVINSSPGDLAPVFDAMLEKAMRLCGAAFGSLYVLEGEHLRSVAQRGVPEAYANYRATNPPSSTGAVLAELIQRKRPIHVLDMKDHERYRASYPDARAIVDLAGARTTILVPLVRDETFLGYVSVFRQEVRAFSDKQIALLQNFAAQAVIAMENARLLTETREALERQTATAEILQVINSSPGNLAPVFEAMLERAICFCQADEGLLTNRNGNEFEVVATRSSRPEMIALSVGTRFAIDRGTVGGRAMLEGRTVHIRDVNADPEYRNPRLGKVGTLLGVPLLREGGVVGSFSLARERIEAFTEQQIAVVESFAAQAVIAMENARLLTETREALEQQTATAEVLRVINASPGDLTPVFEAILEKVHNLCGVTHGALVLREGEIFRAVATHSYPDSFASQLRQGYHGADNPLTRSLINGERFVHIPDLAQIDHPMVRASVQITGVRTGLYLPLRKDGVLLGMISSCRKEIRPFSDKEIALLENFAAQAVIAMENARLLGALRQRTSDLEQSLEYQTATSDVLKVISRSTFDLQAVLDTLLATAARLCGATRGFIATRDEESFRPVATIAASPEAHAFLRGMSIKPGRGTIAGEALLERRAVHVADIAADPAYASAPAVVTSGAAPPRSLLGVPLLRETELIGVITLARSRVEPFTGRQIELVRTFADQAVIAMENARLITETREALERQTATAEVLQVINASPGDLTPVFEAMLEKAMRLCGAAFGLMSTYDGGRFHRVAERGVPAAASEFTRRNAGLGTVYGPGTAPALLVEGANVVHNADLMAEEVYQQGEPNRRALVDLGGARSHLSVALRKDQTLLGFLAIYRQEVRQFSDKEVALLQNFAEQAVIAMENARLLGELHQRTDEVAELNRGLEARVAEQVEELGRVGRLKRFLAPQLAELIVSQGNEKILESHRREIVVVFCDLRGYTAFTETAEPEEVLDFLRDYHGALGPLVAQFEGTLDQFSGDGIMVFFNDPVPIPDPAERAVRMAMAMREAAEVLIAKWRRRGRELGFGAGIAQGYATLGQIGFAERSGYTAIGTVCNLAARLCAEAKDGQILLAQRLAVAVEEIAALEEIGPLSLKGLTQPVVAYNVPLAATQPALRVIEGGPPRV